MRQEVVMPQLGLTMTEGAVSAWLKKPGEKIERGEILFLVQTDKVEMEVESFISGHLDQVLVAPDVMVDVGTVIATIEDGKATTKTPPQADAAISPRARKLAASLGINLSLLKPLKGGRISEDDVRGFHSKAGNTGKSPEPVKEIDPNRAVIAQRMTSSFQSAPHFYLTAQVDVSKLVELRNANVDAFQESHGVKITYTDFFLRAMAIALREKPEVNSFWGSNQVKPLTTVDLSMATQTPHGLLTPVIRGADSLSFAELAKQRAALAGKARARKLILSEMEGGSATLSNLGGYGVDAFYPILNPPQSVILATGRIAKRPIVIEDTVEARFTVFLSLASDHRVLDGAQAAEFLDRIRGLLESPGDTLI